MKIINAYKCDFCRKLYATEKGCGLHERKCGLNPSNKSACVNCDFLEVSEREYSSVRAGFQGVIEDAKTTKRFHCSKLNLELRSYKLDNSEVLKIDDYYSQTFRMPLECGEWKGADILKDIQITHIIIDSQPIQTYPNIDRF